MENQHDKNRDKDNEPEMTTRKDEAGYTPQEQQFADGKGTRLSEEIKPARPGIEDERSEQVEGTFEDQHFGEEDLDKDAQGLNKQDE